MKKEEKECVGVAGRVSKQLSFGEIQEVRPRRTFCIYL
jgi:hypothetical protein